MRLVLDSNVWLDWLLFDDPGVFTLKQARHNGTIEIVIDAACRDELVRVLGYDRFALDPAAQAAMLTEADRLSSFVENLCYRPAASLPWCSDPDDVKFLALADAADADWLITMDKALLGKPRRRQRENAAYRIATPLQWSLSQEATTNRPFPEREDADSWRRDTAQGKSPQVVADTPLDVGRSPRHRVL